MVSEPTPPHPEEPAGKKQGPPTAVVRYGLMNLIGEFTIPRSIDFANGARLVIQTDRGVEIGTHVPYTSNGCSGCGTCSATIPREKMRDYMDECGPEYMRPRAGRILRAVNDSDIRDEQHILAHKHEKLVTCRDLIGRHGLPMKIVECEELFGGERIVFYFMSETRLDFRDLVRDLAGEFHTRIEMRQVGARDEARLVADYETCGRECCCKNFLKVLKPISMRMAKMQKATLDPSKVSGRCGRLKCCLRYEQQTYEELDRRLPRIGDSVLTPRGAGRVVDRQVITQLLMIEGQAGERYPLPYEEVLARNGVTIQHERTAEPARREEPREADHWETDDVYDLTDRPPPRRAEPPPARSPGPERPPRPPVQPGGSGEAPRPQRGDRRRGRRGGRRRRRGGGGGRPGGPTGG